MNILYISKLKGYDGAGPTYSVPNQIKAQSSIDNVFWYNINHICKKEWLKLTDCHCLNDYPRLSIRMLPHPFCNPDLVIFQGFHEFFLNKIVYEVWKRKIPYIIIPRSSLTEKAYKQKKIKKVIANLLFLNKFINKSLSIQYLTKDEQNDSFRYIYKNSIVIPNGIEKKEYKKNFNKSFNNKLHGLYIGRINLYQKGLDLLIESCKLISNNLRRNNIVIELYGPDSYNSKSKLIELINENKLNDIIQILDGIYGEEKEIKYLKADFFIMTSRFEGHSMGLLEALSYGLPCLVSKGTNMEDEIVDADAGWSAGSDINGIIEGFNSLIQEKGFLFEKSKNAYNLSQKYNWEKISKISHKTYKGLINDKK